MSSKRIMTDPAPGAPLQVRCPGSCGGILADWRHSPRMGQYSKKDPGLPPASTCRHARGSARGLLEVGGTPAKTASGLDILRAEPAGGDDQEGGGHEYRRVGAEADADEEAEGHRVELLAAEHEQRNDGDQ